MSFKILSFEVSKEIFRAGDNVVYEARDGSQPGTILLHEWTVPVDQVPTAKDKLNEVQRLTSLQVFSVQRRAYLATSESKAPEALASIRDHDPGLFPGSWPGMREEPEPSPAPPADKGHVNWGRGLLAAVLLVLCILAWVRGKRLQEQLEGSQKSTQVLTGQVGSLQDELKDRDHTIEKLQSELNSFGKPLAAEPVNVQPKIEEPASEYKKLEVDPPHSPSSPQAQPATSASASSPAEIDPETKPPVDLQAMKAFLSEEQNLRNSTTSMVHTIEIRNECTKQISVALRYLSLQSKWVTRGWFPVSPGSNLHPDAYSLNGVFYLYVKGDARHWDGSRERDSVEDVVAPGEFLHVEGQDPPDDKQRVSMFKRSVGPDARQFSQTFCSH